MSKVYQEFPQNYSDIEKYLISAPDQIIDLFFKHEKHFFYDTCSIIHHSNASSNDFIIEFLLKHSAVIIITKTVLMELSSSTFVIDPIQIDYLRKVHENGIPILFIAEEIVMDILKDALSISNEEANVLLGYAVKEVSKFKTATYNIINTLDEGVRNRIANRNPGSETLYEPFFKYARHQKSEGDSLAEELILISIIILTRIPVGKYILISDDLKIRSNVISVNSYIEKHHGRKAPMQLTTSRLIYEMYKNEILTVRDDMMNILSASFHGNVKVYYVGEEDIQLVDESFSKDDLLNQMLTIPEFRIVY